jgi:hypothetical protein
MPGVEAVAGVRVETRAGALIPATLFGVFSSSLLPAPYPLFVQISEDQVARWTNLRNCVLLVPGGTVRAARDSFI